MRAAEAASPIADDELVALFAPIADANTVALAVSGGADSLALLDCIDRFQRRIARLKAVVLTVDHRLRDGSSAEVAEVAAVARAREMPSRILVWEGPHPESGVEAEARAARYRLLLRATREIGASHLLTAHHREDQAETFLMRIARGSGVFGLAAMRPEVRSGEITIFRPFLNLPRSRLAATTAAAGLVPAADPMNNDPRFLRVRMRRLLPLLGAEGIAPEELAATARRLAGAADAIDRATDRLIEASVTIDKFAIAWIDRTIFLAEPREVRLRLLARLLMAIGGESFAPRFERLSSLFEAMATGRVKRTLGGAVVELRGARFAVYREIGRNSLSEIEVGPGFLGQWDHRFEVNLGTDAPAGLVLGALGESDRIAIGATAQTAPADALAALPALRRGPTLIAVPSLDWFTDPSFSARVRPILADRLVEPPRFPELPLE